MEFHADLLPRSLFIVFGLVIYSFVATIPAKSHPSIQNWNFSEQTRNTRANALRRNWLCAQPPPPQTLCTQRRESLVFFSGCKKVFTRLTTFLITPRFSGPKKRRRRAEDGCWQLQKSCPPCSDLQQVLSTPLLYHA